MRIDTKGNPTPELVGELQGGYVVDWPHGAKGVGVKCTRWFVHKYKVGQGNGETDNATLFANLESGETQRTLNTETTRDHEMRVVDGACVEGHEGGE